MKPTSAGDQNGEHVVRAQTDAEYLRAHGGSHEAGEEVVQRILQPHVPFQKLCDSDRKKEIEDTHHGVMYKRTVEDTERICIKTLSPEDKEETISVDWKVFRSKRGFDNLFWD